MAVTSLITCDLHRGDAPKATSHTFSFDNRSYEIDLCDDHLNRLQTTLQEYIDNGRRTGGRAAPTARGRAKAAPAPAKPVSSIREWARRNGMEISAKGRIPLTIVQAYESSTAAAGNGADESAPSDDTATTETDDAPATTRGRGSRGGKTTGSARGGKAKARGGRTSGLKVTMNGKPVPV